MGLNFFIIFSLNFSTLSPWRNRLARSAVNRKVGGSSPPGDGIFFSFLSFFFVFSHFRSLIRKLIFKSFNFELVLPPSC